MITFVIINLTVFVCGITACELEKHPFFAKLPQSPYCSTPVALNRIVGGYETSIGQHPWIAQLGYTMVKCEGYDTQALYYDCGGSLITPKHVLTAAHCADISLQLICPWTRRKANVSIWDVKLGEWNQKTERDCMGNLCSDAAQIIRVLSVTIHKDYVIENLSNDIAMIVLARAAKVTAWVNPICLPMGNMLNKDFIGYNAEVAGWGKTNNNKYDKTEQKILKGVTIPIIRQRNCAGYWDVHGKSPAGIICAGGKEGQDSCAGDSGGPMTIMEDVAGVVKKYLIGLVSFGPSYCGKQGKPAVYTRITFYMKWIVDNLI